MPANYLPFCNPVRVTEKSPGNYFCNHFVDDGRSETIYFVVSGITNVHKMITDRTIIILNYFSFCNPVMVTGKNPWDLFRAPLSCFC